MRPDPSPFVPQGYAGSIDRRMSKGVIVRLGAMEAPQFAVEIAVLGAVDGPGESTA